jgi:hypothetical protein
MKLHRNLGAEVHHLLHTLPVQFADQSAVAVVTFVLGCMVTIRMFASPENVLQNIREFKILRQRYS